MMTSSVKLTRYARRYRSQLLRLIHEEYRQHLHLDWQTVDDWIDDTEVPVFLAWDDDDRLVGAIAASAPMGRASWLRLTAIDDDVDAGGIFSELWHTLRAELLNMAVTEVGVLVLRPWLTPYLEAHGFQYTEDIITMRREESPIPDPLGVDVAIRRANLEEVPQVLEIDHAAFGPMWQLSFQSLRQAARLSASFTVAEYNGQMVGYQLTTQHYEGAHLARLATLPALQGMGIGGLLLGEMIKQFHRRGIDTISVNTQETNMQSRRLYERYGFRPSGLDMPYWAVTISRE
jgi:ribosomal protein S18 acetylase RimI-like enzyme